MTFVSNLSIPPTLAALLLLGGFALFGGLFAGFSFRFVDKRGSRVVNGVASLITLVAAVAFVVPSFTLPYTEEHTARVALQEQAEQVYGIDLPYGAAAFMLDGTEIRRSLYDLAHHNDAAAGILERGGTAEWVNDDGSTSTAQLAWNGEEWILAQADLEDLTELERR